MTIGDATARLGLPFIQPGQAQKEMWHNEALLTLDLLVQASVVAVGRNDPPAAPAIGEAWVVGATPSGAWDGRAASVAGWTAGGWRFVPPAEGMAVWSVADGIPVRFVGGAWTTGRQPEIAAPAGGVTVDAEARAAIAAVLETLRAQGLIAR